MSGVGGGEVDSLGPLQHQGGATIAYGPDGEETYAGAPGVSVENVDDDVVAAVSLAMSISIGGTSGRGTRDGIPASKATFGGSTALDWSDDNEPLLDKRFPQRARIRFTPSVKISSPALRWIVCLVQYTLLPSRYEENISISCFNLCGIKPPGLIPA